MLREQRLGSAPERLMAEAVELWNQPDTVTPRSLSQFMRASFGDKRAIPQLGMGLKFKAVIHLDHDRVCASGGKLGQRSNESLRVRIFLQPQMHAAPHVI